MNTFTKAAMASLMLIAGSSAYATQYTVTGIAPGSGGFGANVFHESPGGPVIAEIVSISGTYDDVTNVLELILGVDADNNGSSDFTVGVTNSSGWDFDADADSFLDVISTADFQAPAGMPVISAQFTFTPGDQCCSGGDIDPNSFTAVDDHFLLTLWGQSTLPILLSGPGSKPNYLGVDIRAKLEPVPLPAAVILFGSALAGLMGLRQRRHKLATNAA